jgi:glycosyltransferase XagB
LQQKPFPSAKHGLVKGQVIGLSLIILLLCLLPVLALNPLALAALLFSPVFLTLIVLQIGMSIDSLAFRNSTKETALEKTLPNPAAAQGSTGSQNPRDWPSYSLLIPLLKEEIIIAQLYAALRALDYPRERLEILFLVEEHDDLTQNALWSQIFLSQPLSSAMQMIIVPPGHPGTKPRALNHGLSVASGTYVTVYDAEDIPDPDQLKRAVVMFETSPPDVLCLQAHLVIDNGADSWLAMMMLVEYAGLFEIIKPGLARSGMPVALGGTSNHFRRETLQKLGGWDAYNVTEDADMGFRIARSGGLVSDLDSDTMEEAPVALKDWLGQRRRWLKGWIQTGICHSRNPRRAIAEMGLTQWLVAMAQVIGAIAGTLLFPFFSLWLGWNIWQGTLFWAETWLDIASNSIAIVIFLAGMAAMILPAALGLRQKGLWHLIPWLITLPFYQCLMFWAACLAVSDVVRNPFHWEKTRHGIGNRMQLIKRRR